MVTLSVCVATRFSHTWFTAAGVTGGTSQQWIGTLPSIPTNGIKMHYNITKYSHQDYQYYQIFPPTVRVLGLISPTFDSQLSVSHVFIPKLPRYRREWRCITKYSHPYHIVGILSLPNIPPMVRLYLSNIPTHGQKYYQIFHSWSDYICQIFPPTVRTYTRFPH